MSPPWTLARRAERMNPSVIREILKLTQQPGIVSLAGGLPSPRTFPVDAFAQACAEVLATDGPAALQYAASEGHGPLREWVTAQLPWPVDPAQVLITTGSQQALDLVGKVLIDNGSRVLVETPTYLGARDALVQQAARLGLPLVEDNPYGELWFDQPPPAPLTARHPDGCLYIGSFSKVLAPGLRLGYVVAPKAIHPKLLQAKQAADLHTPGFNQRLAHEVLRHGFMERHVPAIRTLYRQQCRTMLEALSSEMADLGVQWNAPQGGMFLWLRLPEGLDATALLPQAVARGVAYVPGGAFYADQPDPRTLRLSFVTASEDQIRSGIAALASTVREALPRPTAVPAARP